MKNYQKIPKDVEKKNSFLELKCQWFFLPNELFEIEIV